MTVIDHQQPYLKLSSAHTLEEIRAISAFLHKAGTFTFTPLSNYLYPAAALDSRWSYTGYSYIWVRDNIHIAHAHYRSGRPEIAIKNLRTLMTYFIGHRRRFLDIINGAADPAIPMNRPHIRFDGNSLEEIREKWPHAQNDALGAFLWMFCKLVNENALVPTQDEWDMLDLFPLYFEAIQYWQDEDSGHWEEVRKVSASSIGVVVAGLRQLTESFSRSKPQRENQARRTAETLLGPLVEHGQAALREILPWECRQPDPLKQRRYDAALLFLIYPLRVIEGEIEDRILEDVITHLQGEIGIRRYLGDSYWAPDYKKKLKPAERTADASDDMAARNRLLPAIGLEAQWCLFDPIISCVFGLKFKSTRSPHDLAMQIEYLNRALRQITSPSQTRFPAFRCPELYYLEDGRYVCNDHVPLLWSQANLMLGLKLMEESCSLAA